jgi:hypothetical protein
VSLIQAVNDYQVLLTRQVEKLFFNGKQSPAQRRLSRLYQHEYLERHVIGGVTTAPAAAPIAYTITRLGGQVLIDQFGYEYKNLRIPTKAGLSVKFLDHLLHVNDVRIAVTLATQKHGYELVSWVDEPYFRAHPDQVEVVDGRGKKSRKPVLPDGFFTLKVPQGTARFFLELDRGTEPHHKFKPQIEVYHAYFQSGLYQERFQAKGVRVLIVTTTLTRLEGLKSTTAQAVGKSHTYWFTTAEAITPETVLTTPIWQQLGSEKRLSLVLPD